IVLVNDSFIEIPEHHRPKVFVLVLEKPPRTDHPDLIARAEVLLFLKYSGSRLKNPSSASSQPACSEPLFGGLADKPCQCLHYFASWSAHAVPCEIAA